MPTQRNRENNRELEGGQKEKKGAFGVSRDSERTLDVTLDISKGSVAVATSLH